MYLRKAKNWNRKQHAFLLQFLFAYFETHPCVDCEETDPLVLTFDHVRGRKMHNISNLVGQHRSFRSIRTEIKKCDVRCANCHLRKTARQLGYLKFMLLSSKR